MKLGEIRIVVEVPNEWDEKKLDKEFEYFDDVFCDRLEMAIESFRNPYWEVTLNGVNTTPKE